MVGGALRRIVDRGAAPLADHYSHGRVALPYADAANHLSPGDRVVSVSGICEIDALYGSDLQRRVLYVTGESGVNSPPAKLVEQPSPP
jgi:hypothetical protein